MLSRVLRQNMRNIMAVQPRRFFLNEIGLDSNSIALRDEDKNQKANLQLWQQNIDRQNSLVVKSDDEIQDYVLSICRDYFRTTKKASLTLDSNLKEHGLDSLDAIELVIQIEDELGYLIEAENLELFQKPRHFVNFIKQLEAYKEEHKRLPHEGLKYEFDAKKAFPGIPGFSAWADKQ